ncbi:MAG: toprim domain-containing protein [bacterium]|nr:toprim domain-containing protein [bacterium]
MDNLNRLTDIFRQFPGIGPRQAKRFVYHLLASSDAYRTLLAREITGLASHVSTCPSCFRFFEKKNPASDLCSICTDKARDKASLMVVAKDVDMEAVEKSRVYRGHYFVLGGTLSLVEKEPETKLRQRELIARLDQRVTEGLKEVILALSLNAEGEHTREYIESVIGELVKKHGLRVTVLGRGLSTGTELEYSDSETIKNALAGRKEEILP